MNEINSGISFGRIFATDDAIIAELSLLCEPFVPHHLVATCHIMASWTDKLDDTLQDEFGGKTFFGDHLPAKVGELYGRYL